MNTLQIVPITRIRITKRFRKNPSDVDTLAESIVQTGLLHPVVLDGYELVAGARRIEAYKKLGLTEIPAYIVKVDDILHAEVEENVERKDFTVSELVAIDRELGSKVREEADKRRVEAGRKYHRGSKKGAAKLAEPLAESRDIISRYAGVSHGTLDKAKFIVQAAEKYPTKFGPMLQRVDSNQGHLSAKPRTRFGFRQSFGE